jgi:hypothetical protein
MAMPSPSPGQGQGAGPVQGVLKFNGYGEHSGLLYHSPHTVLYQEELYPTALHPFEAREFPVIGRISRSRLGSVSASTR